MNAGILCTIHKKVLLCDNLDKLAYFMHVYVLCIRTYELKNMLDIRHLLLCKCVTVSL